MNLKKRFGNNYTSVRKAFLNLNEGQQTGVLTVQNFLFSIPRCEHYPQIEDDIRYLINLRDSTGKGQLNYLDFSAWVGSSIHVPETFYFRHDSVKNPQFDESMVKFNLQEAKLDQIKLSMSEK